MVGPCLCGDPECGSCGFPGSSGPLIPSKITLVAAIGYGNGIGSRGRLPWQLPEDLKRFRAITMGHHCVVGYRTYIGMPYLDGRTTHVVPQHGTLSPARFEQFLEDLASDEIDEIMVIGGARVYEVAMPFATHLELTRVGIQLPAGTYDAFFPEVDWTEWNMLNQEYPEDDHRLAFWSLEKKYD